MSLYLLNYYFFKDSIKNINQEIISSAKIDNNTLFKQSFFYNSCDFYNMLNPFKKNPYRIASQLKTDSSHLFFKEILIESKKSNDNELILFTYAIILSHFLNTRFKYYIDKEITRTKNRYYVEKMIDSYFFNKFEKMSLYKINIADYFFDGFNLDDKYLDFIDKPIVRSFGLFCCKTYFENAYINAYKYYDFHATKHINLKNITHFFIDLFFNHKKGKRKAITYTYHKKIDTTILNLQKKEYQYEDYIINHSIDEFYNKLLKDSKQIINALNDYYNTENLKPFYKLFPINTL